MSKEIYMLIDDEGHFYLDETQCVWTDAWDATEECAQINRDGADYRVCLIDSGEVHVLKTVHEHLHEKFVMGELGCDEVRG